MDCLQKLRLVLSPLFGFNHEYIWDALLLKLHVLLLTVVKFQKLPASRLAEEED